MNYELAHCKAFWVDAQLVESLSHTTLDISDDVLRLPFPACAFLFDDNDTLKLAQKIVDATREFRPGRLPFRMVTLYGFPTPEEYDEDGLRLVFLFDAFDGEWPYLISRGIPTDHKRNIDEILDSHPDNSNDPFFRLPELRRLVHLGLNAVLYTTCSDFRYETREPPKRTRTAQNNRLSGETVFSCLGEYRSAESDDMAAIEIVMHIDTAETLLNDGRLTRQQSDRLEAAIAHTRALLSQFTEKRIQDLHRVGGVGGREVSLTSRTASPNANNGHAQIAGARSDAQ